MSFQWYNAKFFNFIPRVYLISLSLFHFIDICTSHYILHYFLFYFTFRSDIIYNIFNDTKKKDGEKYLST